MTAVRFAQPQHTMKALPGAAVSFLHTIKCIVLPVLDLDPVLSPSGLIGPVAMRSSLGRPFLCEARNIR